MHPPRPLTGRHVLLMLLAFFGLVFTTNFYMVYMARATFNGLTDDKAYEKGLAYNDVLEQGRMQDGRGWSAKAMYADGRFKVVLEDRDGPVSGAAGTATLFRVTTAGEDVSAPLTPADEPGLYTASMIPPQPGLWELRVDARHGGRSYTSRQRMDIRF